MGFENSPSLKDYEHGLPERPPDSSNTRRKVWGVIGGLVLLVALLALVNLQRGESGILLTGSDVVVGTVVDEAGQPLQADILMLKTDLEVQTDAMGRFELKGAPAGPQTLIVAHLGAGREYPVVVSRGAVTDVGIVQFASTKVPEQ